MSTYKSFGIVGFGEVGSLFVNEFLISQRSAGYELRVLTRTKNKPELKDIATKNVDIFEVDYSSPQSIENALRGVDVVLSALRDDGWDIQNDVIRAAKAAGVKLFVPSEYGRNTIDNTYKYLKAKSDAHVLMKELDLPYTLFFTGIRPELLPSIGSYFGTDLEAGKFTLFGDGRPPASWTSPRDFIPFVHHIITTLPPSALENKVFEIEGDRKSFRDLVSLWERKHGRPAAVIELSPAETQKFIDEQVNPLFKFIPAVCQRGDMLVSGESNKLWPQWKHSTWEDWMP